MDMNTHSKLIMAVVQEDDYDATVSQLNKNGFFVTMLSSTGGFWKKKNITIMLGVAMPTGSQYAAAMPSVPVNVELGGVTVFVMDLEKLEKY